MKIQNRLSLYNSIIFGIILAVISLLTYGIYYSNTKKIIYSNLKNTAYITALFYLEEDELNNEEFAKIRSQFDEFVNNSYYQIYNSQDSISYGSHFLRISPVHLNEIRKKGALSFSDDDFFCYGIFYEDNQGNFVIVSREKKDLVFQQMSVLLWILIISFILGILIIIILVNRWISRVAYQPFREAIKQVKNISTSMINPRIEVPPTQDELQDLLETFNDLLAKISETFQVQKNFVNYVSHEFKTPLTAMLGNLEVFSLKDRNPNEYKQLSDILIQQINQLEEILNTLIIISDLRNKSDISTSVRVDELIWEIISKVGIQYPNTDIAVNMHILPKEENILWVSVERTQLLIALYNLIENAVKYSGGSTVDIEIINNYGKLNVLIADKGIGIPPEELENISKPFYRAQNTNMVMGSGIGLSIALRILEKNDIGYSIDSVINVGTTVRLKF